MESKWIGRSDRTASRPERRAVAIYQAEVGLAEVSSTLTLSVDEPREVAVAAIMEPPQWAPFAWPDFTPETDQELRRFSLLKLLTVFEFGSRLGGDTGEAIRDQLLAIHPVMNEIVVRGEDTSRFKRFPVEATIYHDGYFSGTYDHVSEGESLPLVDGTWGTLDRYVKNMVRVDIRLLLEKQEGVPKSVV